MLMLFFFNLTKIYAIMVVPKVVVYVFSEYNFNTVKNLDWKSSNVGSCKKWWNDSKVLI